MEFGIIHFNILFNTFQSLKCQKGPKMAILDLKMAIDLSKKYFLLINSEKLYYEVWNHPFWYIIYYLSVSQMSLKCLESSILALVFYGYQANPSLCITISPPPFVGGG